MLSAIEMLELKITFAEESINNGNSQLEPLMRNSQIEFQSKIDVASKVKRNLS